MEEEAGTGTAEERRAWVLRVLGVNVPPASKADQGPGGIAIGGAAAVKSLLAEQIRRATSALAAAPSLREDLLSLASIARDHFQAGDLEATQADIVTLQHAVDQIPTGDDGEPGGKHPRMIEPQTEAADEEDEADGANVQSDIMLVGYTSAKAKAPGGPPKKKSPAQDDYVTFKALVPKGTKTVEEMYRIFEMVAYGRVMNLPWSCNGYCDMAKNQGKVIPFDVHRAAVEARRDPAAKKRSADDQAALKGLPKPQKAAVEAEAARRYANTSGEKPDKDAHTQGTGQADVYDRSVSSVMQDRELLHKLPADVAALLGGKGGGEYDPKTYTQLLRIVETLKSFSPEDLKLYRNLPLKATDNLDLFEQSLQVFLQHKEEIRQQIENEKQNGATPPPDDIKDVWTGFENVDLKKMSTDQREDLARAKADALTEAQLKHMAENPGETVTNFAKSATLMNTGETMQAVGKDVIEALDGNAEGYARWAAGAGAGAKISGWLMAAAGVLYVASWLTGVGELATIAAGAGILLGANLTLSVAESELRIKAAAQTTDPAEFQRNVEAAAAARANIALCVALIIVAAVLHFTAKALFPEQVAKLKTALKNFREKIRLKGSLADLKGGVLKDMATSRAAIAKAADAAKAHASGTARELASLSTEQFVDHVEKGGAGGFLDQSKVPAEQKLNLRELLKSDGGRSAIETYKHKLISALQNDIPAQIDRLASNYLDSIDEFTKSANGAATGDELAAAANALEDLLGEEHAKKFMEGEQNALVEQKLRDAAEEMRKDLEDARSSGQANEDPAIADLPEKIKQFVPAAKPKAEALLAKAKAAEPAITKAIEDETKQNGGKMIGLEHRLKESGSLTRKIATDMSKAGLSADEAASGIYDAIRYTSSFPPEKLVAGAEAILAKLKAQGHVIVELKNGWLKKNSTYKGINVQLRSPTGEVYELQFHTPESFWAKDEGTHHIFDQMRKLDPTDPEYKAKYDALDAQQLEVVDKLRVPDNIDRLQPIKKGKVKP